MAPTRIEFEVAKLGPITNFQLERDGVFLPDGAPAPCVFATWHGAKVAVFGVTTENRALSQVVEAPAHHAIGQLCLKRGERRQIPFAELEYDEQTTKERNGTAPEMYVPPTRDNRRPQRGDTLKAQTLTEADALRIRIAELKKQKELQKLRAEAAELEKEEVARLQAELLELTKSETAETNTQTQTESKVTQ